MTESLPCPSAAEGEAAHLSSAAGEAYRQDNAPINHAVLDKLSEQDVRRDTRSESTLTTLHDVPREGDQVSTHQKDEDEVDRPGSLDEDDDQQAFSIFTTKQKRLIVLAGSFCGFFSPVTANIYYPALQTIAQDLNVTNTAINLTVTTYLILQGIAPTFVGAFSDSAGRRPALAYCFIVYIIANIGLGIQNSYAALITLRCIQSAGTSGTIALANGIAADVVTTSERGAYVAYASLGSLIGPSLGPVIGGLISQYLGWHWIFWFLAIVAGVFFVPLMLFLPETNRNVVGDGSYRPPLHCQSLTGVMIAKSLKKRGIMPDEEEQRRLREQYRLRFPNPLETLAIACDKASFIILLSSGLIFAGLYTVLTGVSVLFSDIYGFNDLQNALCFLPFGAGMIVASPSVGRLIDWNFQRHAIRLGFPIAKHRIQNLEDFPLERARLEIAFPLLFMTTIVGIIYGWVLHFRTHLAGPLVLLFFSGAGAIGMYQALNIMLIDSYPNQAATATAANNLFRCLIGAAATAILGPLLDSWGPGWTYTFISLLIVTIAPLLFIVIKQGPKWRKQRAVREETRQLKKAKAREASLAREKDKSNTRERNDSLA